MSTTTDALSSAATHAPAQGRRPGERTRAVHAGRADLTDLGVHAPPLDLSSTYPLPDVDLGGDSYEAMATGGRPTAGGNVYARLWNPTVARFEDALADLEGTSDAVAFGSGMAALTAVLLACVHAGRPHVVAVRPLYGGSDHLLATGMLGTQVTWASADTVAESVRPDTGLVVFETPANPTLELVDIAAVVAQAGDVPVLVDSTFATPVLQQPARHGAALVMHSATKFLGGHGDVVGGVVACGDEWAHRLRSVRAITGALLHPLAAYLLQRGLPTLPLRVRAQQQTACEVAAWLSDHPRVTAVHHPSLAGADPLGLLGRQQAGPGSLLAFEVRGGAAAARAVASGVRLITHAVSLGGVDTLIQHPASLTHRPVEASAKPVGALLRLSCGLEDAADVIADLDQALTSPTP
ncbi:PLP-dependent aspartate aminotransferase family protein [Angustibacter sp. Root456]|uniref:trans-sulfuration enzyme family protein n=1 Tax=Angustibacter sp. Root456 TaxID=1736539 RepID=UPI0009EA29C7|nr:aminotransferase class I/II-fold pyridoxal phosphate-dependent enzyme [Angustibacter sp. Root456]